MCYRNNYIVEIFPALKSYPQFCAMKNSLRVDEKNSCVKISESLSNQWSLSLALVMVWRHETETDFTSKSIPPCNAACPHFPPVCHMSISYQILKLLDSCPHSSSLNKSPISANKSKKASVQIHFYCYPRDDYFHPSCYASSWITRQNGPNCCLHRQKKAQAERKYSIKHIRCLQGNLISKKNIAITILILFMRFLHGQLLSPDTKWWGKKKDLSSAGKTEYGVQSKISSPPWLNP